MDFITTAFKKKIGINSYTYRRYIGIEYIIIRILICLILFHEIMGGFGRWSLKREKEKRKRKKREEKSEKRKNKKIKNPPRIPKKDRKGQKIK